MFRWIVVVIGALALASLMRSTLELSSLASPIALLLDTVDAFSAFAIGWQEPHLLAVGDWLRPYLGAVDLVGHWRSVVVVFVMLGLLRAEVTLAYGFSEVNAGDNEPRTGLTVDRFLSALISVVWTVAVGVLACFFGAIFPLGVLTFWFFVWTVSSIVYYQSTKRYAEQNDFALRDVLFRDGWWREYLAIAAAAGLASAIVAIGFVGREVLG